MKRLKEPVVQCGALAMILFGYYGLVAEPENPIAESRTVEISQTDVKLLISAFEATWKRPPSRSELDSLVEDNIREEVLVREALALGLNGGCGDPKSASAEVGVHRGIDGAFRDADG